MSMDMCVRTLVLVIPRSEASALLPSRVHRFVRADVSELDGRIVVLDRENRVLDSFGSVGERGRGWPNRLYDEGKPARPYVEDGKLHTPHAIAFDAEGNVDLSEWFIGGRLVRLERQD